MNAEGRACAATGGEVTVDQEDAQKASKSLQTTMDPDDPSRPFSLEKCSCQASMIWTSAPNTASRR
jgi:hypothetical protein